MAELGASTGSGRQRRQGAARLGPIFGALTLWALTLPLWAVRQDAVAAAVAVAVAAESGAPDDEAIQAFKDKVRVETATLVHEALDDYFTRASLPKPNEVRIEAQPDLVRSAPGGLQVRTLSLAVTLVSEHPPTVIREARARIARALTAHGYRLTDEPEVDASQPFAALRVDVVPPAAVRTVWKSGLKSALVFACLVFASVAGMIMAIMMFLRPFLRRREVRKAAPLDLGARGTVSDPVAMRRGLSAFVGRAGGGDPDVGLPALPGLSWPMATPVGAGAGASGLSSGAISPRPRRAPIIPSESSSLPLAAASTPEIGAASRPLTGTAPPRLPPPPEALAPPPGVQAPPAPDGRDRTPVTLREVRLDHEPLSPAPSLAAERVDDEGEPVDAVGERPLAPPLEGAALLEAPRSTLQDTFDRLPFERALQLLAGLDERTRQVIIDRLQLNAAVRRRIERELAETYGV